MFSWALVSHDGLISSRRLPWADRLDPRVSVLEATSLVAVGVAAALATAFVRIKLQIPGHSIVFAVFPMAFGMALAPRRMAGSIMGTSALLTAAALHGGGLASIGSGALTSLCVSGPLMDLALLGVRNGRRVYVALVLTGLASNLLAFAVRAATKLAGLEPGLRQFAQWWPQAAVSYVVCGAVAGLISALAWFQFAAGSPDAIGREDLS